jgi:WD40 repeat protein
MSTWPLSQDYNEAIQDPPSAFADLELRGGQVRLNALGLPQPCSGNFADVYEVTCPATQSTWAVKCFTREVPGLQQRYTAVSRHLLQASLPFTVEFVFLPQGIRVHGNWYPALKMRWVEGFLLNHFVRDNLDKPALLQAMQQIWVRLARRLREANLAHGDLQHGNVLLVPGSKAAALAVKLIDYDGMWVPALAKSRSGEVGHPNYQHPQRLREGTYNSEVDRFPFLVTATALRALSIGGRGLWERYDNGDNLLFREPDLRAPDESPLFRELAASTDPGLKRQVAQLRQACRARLEDTPLLEEALPEEKATAVQVVKPPPVPTAAATAVTTAWDFESGSQENDRPRRKTRRRKRASVSAWVWAAAGVGVAALVGVAFAFSVLGDHSNPTIPGTQVVQNTPPTSKPVPPASTIPAPPATTAPVPPQTRPVPPETRPNPPDTRKPDPPAVNPVTARPLFQMLGNSAELLAMAGDEPTAVWQLYNTFEPTAEKRVVKRFTTARPSPVVKFQATPDGAFAITICQDHHAYLWDTKKSEPILSMFHEDTRYPIVVAAVAADGKQAFTSHGERNFGIWDVAKKELVSANTVEGNVSALAVSPDGTRIACGLTDPETKEHWISIRDLPIGEVRKVGIVPSKITCLAVSPDGKRLASAGSDNFVRVWEIDKEGEQGRFGPFGAPVSRIQFTADGNKVMAETGSQTMVWGFRSHRTVGGAERKPEDRVTCSFDNGGTQLGIVTQEKGQGITRGGGSLDAERDAAPPPVVAGKGLFQMLGASIDRVALTEADRSVWRLQHVTQRDDVRRFVGHKGPITCLAASGSGNYAITGSEDRTARIWDVNAGLMVSELKPHKRGVNAVALSPDHSLALTADGGSEAILWDVATASESQRFTLPGSVTCLAFSNDSKAALIGFAAEGMKEGKFRIQPLDGAEAKDSRAFPGPVTAIAAQFTKRGRAVFAVSSDGTFLRWDHRLNRTNSGVVTSNGPIRSISLSENHREVLLCSERSYAVWSARQHKELCQLVTARKKMAANLFNDGRQVARIELMDDGKFTSGTEDVPADLPGIVQPPPDDPRGRPDTRFPVPTGGKLDFARQELHKAFKDLYDTKSPMLYNKLYDLTHHPIPGPAGGPDGRYVAIIELRDNALRTGDPLSAINYTKMLGERYQVDRLEELVSTMNKVSLAGKGIDWHKSVAESLLKVLEGAKDDPNRKSFDHLVEVARTAAEKAKDAALRNRVKALSGGAAEPPEPSPELTQALDKVAKSPKDPDANLAAGLACCKEERWAQGLPYLVKGPNKELQEAASLDLGNPKNAAGRASVAQKWLVQGVKDEGMQRVWFRRSRFWYQQALPDLPAKDQEGAKRALDFLGQVIDRGPIKKVP